MQPTEPALSFDSSAPEGASMVVVNGTSAAVQPASASAPAPMALSQETMEVSPSAPQASQMMHGDVASPCLCRCRNPKADDMQRSWLDRAGHILSISWDSDQVASRDISTSRITVDDDDS